MVAVMAFAGVMIKVQSARLRHLQVTHVAHFIASPAAFRLVVFCLFGKVAVRLKTVTNDTDKW